MTIGRYDIRMMRGEATRRGRSDDMISGEEKRTRRGLLLIEEEREALRQARGSAPGAKLEVGSCSETKTPVRNFTSD